MTRRRDKKVEKDIAEERMTILFAKAAEASKKGELDSADRFIELARKIGMKYNVRIPRKYKRVYCKHCYSYLSPSKTSRSRTNAQKRRVEVTCLKCKKRMFYPLRK